MKSVWIVTDGQYSDYHIVAVFETEQQACEFMNGVDTTKTIYGPSTNVGVEEWNLGEPEAGVYQHTYHVNIDLATGDLLNGTYTTESDEIELHPRDWSQSRVYAVGTEQVAAGSSVVSRDHALKIAAEARQAYLREKGQA